METVIMWLYIAGMFSLFAFLVVIRNRIRGNVGEQRLYEIPASRPSRSRRLLLFAFTVFLMLWLMLYRGNLG